MFSLEKRRLREDLAESAPSSGRAVAGGRGADLLSLVTRDRAVGNEGEVQMGHEEKVLH